MPLPHEAFSTQFKQKLKLALDRARANEAPKEVWAVMHFDQEIGSIETFHSHGDIGGTTYQNNLRTLLTLQDHPGKSEKQRYGMMAKHMTDVQMQGVPQYIIQNYVAMHAEEELIKAFPKVLHRWTKLESLQQKRSENYRRQQSNVPAWMHA